MNPPDNATPVPSSGNFLTELIDQELADGVNDEVHTRFPPEPNGYLHLGSAKAIWINYSISRRYGGSFNLRFDDTNPMKESDEFVRAIEEDLRWLGCEPDGGIFFGSDYFEQCYAYAVKLIRDGKAYVCDLSREELTAYRGDADNRADKGIVSPYRDRSVECNLDLFSRMRAGEFPDGARTLRAKIDPDSDNPYLRDPVIYRIKHVHHHRQGDDWCIYPMYDFAHPLQDALEGITYSFCSLEFLNHRPLYEWVIENCGFTVHPPKQREFGRMNVTYTVMSKRYLRYLVENRLVDGWDDPRLPTLCGLRRRGFTPSSIFDFVERAGVARADATVDVELLEHCLREELNASAPRRVCVTRPLRLVIENLPEDTLEYFDLPNNPSDPAAGTRRVPLTRELFIEQDDFALEAPPKFHRLKPGGEVRLMGAYLIRCEDVICDEEGNPCELRCKADLATGCGSPADGRKVRGTIHWVSATRCATFDLALYDKLFVIPDIKDKSIEEFASYLNPASLVRLTGCKGEESLTKAAPGERFQFVRTGYFTPDAKTPGTFNRIVSLKENYKGM